MMPISYDEEEGSVYVDGGEGFKPTTSPCFPLTLKFMDICYNVKLPDPAISGGGLAGKLLRRIPMQDDDKQSCSPETTKTVLSGITGVARPGELLMVLGPSGSGKSTLLSILSGRLRPSSGFVTANGRPVTAGRRIGFVPQEDLFYPHLTVRETLIYAALLRSPAARRPEDRRRAAESVMTELGLEKCADTMVGGGVSGGERRRVSIAAEMLGGAAALVVDEPTSGLDSTAAMSVAATMSRVARKGMRTVVAAVHQPASRVYRMADKVVLLAGEGRCLYYGPAELAMDYFNSVGFSAPTFHLNPADFMLDLANGVAPDRSGDGDDHKRSSSSSMTQTLVSSYNTLLAPSVKAAAAATVAGVQRMSTTRNYAGIGWFGEFSVLLRRGLKERRHESFAALRIAQVLSAALLAGSMWWRSGTDIDAANRLGLLFYISMFMAVYPSFNAVFVFPNDSAILSRELSSGMYRLSPYFAARTAGDLPMELLLPAVFALVTYWMSGLRPEPAAFILTLLLLLGYVLAAQSLGLAIGAALMDARRASAAISVVMLAFLLAGGFYVRDVPLCLAWLKYVSVTFYCYRLLIAIQMDGSAAAVPAAAEIERAASPAACVLALVAMFVGYRLLAYAALRRAMTRRH